MGGGLSVKRFDTYESERELSVKWKTWKWGIERLRGRIPQSACRRDIETSGNSVAKKAGEGRRRRSKEQEGSRSI